MNMTISLSIDVTKLEKSRIVAGKKPRPDGTVGKYVDLVCFVDPTDAKEFNGKEYHGIVKQGSTKEERDSGLQLPILGNATIMGLKQNNLNQNVEIQQQTYADDEVPF